MAHDAGMLDDPWSIWQAMRALVRLAVPIAAGSIVNVFADRATLGFVGHWDYQDRSHFDGASVGKMYSNITGLSLGVAGSIGLSTFCSQAHGNGRSQEMNPIYVRRCAILLGVLFIFSFLSACLCEPFLRAMGQPPAVAHTSAIFAQVQLLGIPFYWAFNTMNSALNACKLPYAGMVAYLTSSVAQICLTVVFTHPGALALGYVGVALGRAVGGPIGVLTIYAYIKWHSLESLVWRLHPEAQCTYELKAFREYLRVSVPSALIVWSEWWAFEVLGLIVGLTPHAETNLAAHGIMFNLIVITYMTFTATSNGVCTLVGNKLGAGRNLELHPLLRAAGLLSICTSLSVALLYELLKGVLAATFTEDIRVQEVMCQSSLGVVFSVPLYAQLMTFYGALRGANMQRPAIVGTVVGYWIVGLPVGGLLADIWHWPTPLNGAWIGNVLALAIAASWVCTAVFRRIDWLSIGCVTSSRSILLPEACANRNAGDEEGGSSMQSK